MDWYLVQIKSNSHVKATQNLQRQNFEVFLPLLSKTFKRAGQFVKKRIPLFPSYLFIGSKSDQISWKSVNATRGVSKVVALDGQYRAINEDIIIELKGRCDANGVIMPAVDITVGDFVKVEKGPFTEFICQVEKLADGERVWVLIDMIQKNTKAKIAINDLSKFH